jgi:hypothetical protein
LPVTPAWPSRLLEGLDASDRRAAQLVKGLDLERLNRKPRPGAWSIGQCLQHLAITNEVYIPPIADSLTAQAARPVEEITFGSFTRWFIRSYIDASPAARPTKAPRKIRPEREVHLSILDRLLEGNQKARALILRASDYDVNHIRFKNPFIPFLRFTTGAGLEIIVRHQGRHLAQAEGRGLSR